MHLIRPASNGRINWFTIELEDDYRSCISPRVDLFVRVVISADLRFFRKKMLKANILSAWCLQRRASTASATTTLVGSADILRQPSAAASSIYKASNGCVYWRKCLSVPTSNTLKVDVWQLQWSACDWVIAHSRNLCCARTCRVWMFAWNCLEYWKFILKSSIAVRVFCGTQLKHALI